MYIYIERVEEDQLSRECWEFYCVLDSKNLKVRFESYKRETRPSRRFKKWRRDKAWAARASDARSIMTVHQTPRPVPSVHVLMRVEEALRESIQFVEE